MPTVPTTFVPQVAPQVGGDIGQFQAPQVATAENLAAQQEVRFGQAMTQAGNVAFRVGSAIQDDIDDATAKAADTWMLTNANDLLRGQNGYLRSVGKGAVDGFQGTQEALAALGQQALDRTTNDTQKRMLQPVIARNMMTFQTQLLDHYQRETKVYATGEAKARADMRVQLAIEDYKNRDLLASEYRVNEGLALQEITRAGELSGFAPDSAQMTALKQGITTSITQGVVNRMMMENEYDAAYKFTKDQIKGGMVEREVGDRLMTAIDANRDRWMVGDYTSNILQYGKAALSTEDKGIQLLKDLGVRQMPESLSAALEIADGIQDDSIRVDVQANLRRQYDAMESARKKAYATNLDTVENLIAKSGIDGVPPMLWNGLDAKDQKRLRKGVVQEDDLKVQEELARNPGLLTEKFLDDNASKLTIETRIRLRKELAQPERIFEATVDAQQLNATLLNNNFENLARPKTDADRAASVLLINNVEATIDAEQQRLGKKLNRREKQDIIDQTIIIEKAKVAGGLFSSAIKAPLSAMTDEQILQARMIEQRAEFGGSETVLMPDMPARAYRDGRRALINAGVSNPTPSQINLWYLSKKQKGEFRD